MENVELNSTFDTRHSAFTRRAASRCLFGLAGGGVYPAAMVTHRAVRSYRTISPLPGNVETSKSQNGGFPFSTFRRFCVSAFPGGLFSVALSLGSRRVGVTNHRALSGSDFPPARQAARAIAFEHSGGLRYDIPSTGQVQMKRITASARMGET